MLQLTKITEVIFKLLDLPLRENQNELDFFKLNK